MYIYHVLINALSAHMIHVNLNMIFYTHTNSPRKQPTQSTTQKDSGITGQTTQIFLFKAL